MADDSRDALVTVLGTSPAFEIAEPSGFTPWDSLCPPNSTARRIAQALPVDTPRGNTLQSFVSIEHVQAMDLCEHPEVRDLNGFTAWCVPFRGLVSLSTRHARPIADRSTLSHRSGPRPYLLYPLFSFTKTSLHADLLLPSVSGDFFAEIGRDPVWEQKKQNRVLWRGETTGAYHSKGSGWRQSQRARLVARALLSLSLRLTSSALRLTIICLLAHSRQRQGRRHDLAPRRLDVGRSPPRDGPNAGHVAPLL